MNHEDDGAGSHGCCAPARRSESGGGKLPAVAAAAPTAETAGPAEPARLRAEAAGVTLLPLPAGTFAMGTTDPDANPLDGEGPVRDVTLAPFAIGATTVTNAQFAAFVTETGHVTGAERFGWSFVFAKFLPGSLRQGAQRPPQAPWWCRVDGATWSRPEGPGSSIDDRLDHPVVHVDHADALAFCEWGGGRLPTEAEWEYAARGGLRGARYAWGDELTPDGEHHCNIWQGRFPTTNTEDDGYAGTAPADAFPPNGFGLHNVAGNVWEWCADRWGTEHSDAPVSNPRGPQEGSARVMRGGSYLCHDSYCNRYRVAARTSDDPDSSSGNVGFRCARSL